MICGYDAFGIFNGVRLHFNQEKYDYFKYNGQSKISFEAFNIRADKYSFVKLGRMMDEQDLPYFSAVNFYEKPKGWVKDFFDKNCSDRYLQWKQNQKNRQQTLTEDFSKISNLKKMIVCVDGQSPELLTKVFQKEIDKDTLVVLDHFMNLTEGWSKHLKDDFIWQDFYLKYKKYKPFLYNYTLFDTTLYKNMIKQMIEVQSGEK